jgi:hypothetical protein
MIAPAVYLFCTAMSLVCALLLLRTYRRTRLRLLLWSGASFSVLAVNNALLFVDLVLLPNVDLLLYRDTVTLIGVALLLYGLVWDT